ncbi:hypothetical protein ILUMI_00976 [Ignelater luminosus]|uniref:Nucleolar protein 12 n=1 Tax=Ignelater luminosus TaxID=2038154 RepID=A0A8K0DG70_IGNLU|nr:hypothetical protein ILUMI_00976 [Ignelater luminosus]
MSIHNLNLLTSLDLYITNNNNMFPKAKRKHEKNRKVKLNLVFNEENRREFLSGFHKRKLQRKKKAKEKLEQELKEEKKRLKAEAKESYKKLVKSHTPIPEIENLLAEEYDDEDVNVKVVELSTNEIAKQNHWIGTNQPSYESDHNESTSENEDDVTEDEVPGMELKLKSKKADSDEEEIDKPKELKSKAEIKKLLKKQATKNVQKSKAFQMKNKIEKQKQKKKALQKRKIRMKIQNKSSKNRNKRSKGLQ